MDGRKHLRKLSSRRDPASDLPLDFTKMVREVYARNFGDGLKALAKIAGKKPEFDVRGKIYSDEIVMGITLKFPDQIAATTVYCSADFDPKASAPTAQDLISVCVDVIGGLYGQLLDPKSKETLEHLASGTLSGMEDIPFEWTEAQFEKRKVWVRIDKANPELEEQADEWLRKNDPNFEEFEDELEEEASRLFMTGPKGGKKGSGEIH